jgi:hypothetical protein
MVPTFYDSIEVARDRMVAKFQMRALKWNALFAFIVTLIEALLTLTFIRLIYRLLKKLVLLFTRRGNVLKPGQA